MAMDLRKSIPTDKFTCPLRKMPNEDMEHRFLGCQYSSQVWAPSNLPGQPSQYKQDAEGWVSHQANALSTEQFGLFLTICWFVWWARSQKLMESNDITQFRPLSPKDVSLAPNLQ